jgi:hypothetical protein
MVKITEVEQVSKQQAKILALIFSETRYQKFETPSAKKSIYK